MLPFYMRVASLNYLSDFRCSADKCPDTCCAGWKVFIDLATLERFTECKDLELEQKLKNSIQLEREDEMTPARAGRFRIDEERRCCVLLEESGLCELQRLGHAEYLPCVCHRYPREENVVDNTRERSATPACPEIARLLLLSDAPVAFELSGEEDRWPDLRHRTIDTSEDCGPVSCLQHFHLLRRSMLQCIQDRKHPLLDRLAHLQECCLELSGLMENKLYSAIPGRFEELVQESREPAAAIAEETLIRRLLKGLGDFEMLEIIQLPAYRKSHALVREVFPDASYESFVRAEECCSGFYQQYPHALENVLANIMLKQLFPFDDGRGVMEQFDELLLYYGLCRIHLAAAGAASGKLDLEAATSALQVFARTWDTNQRFREGLMSESQNRRSEPSS